MVTVELADIRAAADVLEGVIRRTPVELSRSLGRRVGGDVWLKCENLQRTGSFKIRGAYVRIARLSAAERRAGVVAASAGNHAQGVALAAEMLDTPAVVFMPEGAPIPKVQATRDYGAQVRFAGATVDDALDAATTYAEQTGSVLIHPFDHPDVIAGQGTVGLELVEQVPDVRTIVVSAGGGGLVSGVAVAAKASRPDVQVVAVQADGAAAIAPSLAAGHPVPLETMSTMADGIAVGCPGALPLALIDQHVDEVRTVSEDALARALLLCLERAKLVVEPAGAAGVAHVMEHADGLEAPIAVVLSGGNVDPLLMMRVLRHGMTAAGRYLSFHVRVPDRPGELARLLAELAATGANVLDVEHSRTGRAMHLDEVEVHLVLEMRGDAHREEVLSRLRAAGYALSVDAVSD
ncbi:MAG TPA: threonine ammonia-lyase [Mycobacteriales bacterium]|nr:threonine ammonia-lyase [Mycobacteriales bacterium]